MDKVAHLGTTG